MILNNCTNFISDLTTWILLQPVTNKWTCCSNADFKVLYDQNQPFCLQPCSGNPPTTPTPPGGCVNTDWVGDNYCDDVNNNLECNFDGGDCCPPHWYSDWDQYCQACECLKPTTTTTPPTTPPTTLHCKDNWSKNKCSKKCKAKKCKKSKSCKKNCKNSCNQCGIVEACEDQKSSKYCKKQLKKGKCKKSNVQQKCKKTCDKCDTN